MKKYILMTISLFLFTITYGQQKENVLALMNGQLSQKDFVKNTTYEFSKYNLTKEQTIKIRNLVERKAGYYLEIAEYKDKDNDLFQKKMKSQREHTKQYLKTILNDEQYSQFLIDRRKLANDRKRNK